MDRAALPARQLVASNQQPATPAGKAAPFLPPRDFTPLTNFLRERVVHFVDVLKITVALALNRLQHVIQEPMLT